MLHLQGCLINHRKYITLKEKTTLRRSPRLNVMEDLTLTDEEFSHSLFSLEYANALYDSNGKKVKLDDALSGKYNELDTPEIWNQSLSNEFGRIAQGNDAGVKYTDACEFIYVWEVPTNKKVTYANWVLDYRPLKNGPYRIRLVVGGDKLDYAGDSGSPQLPC